MEWLTTVAWFWMIAASAVHDGLQHHPIFTITAFGLAVALGYGVTELTLKAIK